MTFDEISHCLSASDEKIVADMMALFDGIDHQTKEFSTQTGLKCKNGCGACCENPKIETTVTEILPLAVYLWSKGQAEHIRQTIRSKSSSDICVFYQPDPLQKGNGRCGIYAYRPGLCRLFGFSARKDKHGQQELLTCKVIKESQSQACQHTQEQLRQGLEAPLLSSHASAVASIDPVGGLKLLPINQAIALGVEKIGYRLQKLKQLLPTPPE